jgi:hypothetical protein
LKIKIRFRLNGKCTSVPNPKFATWSGAAKAAYNPRFSLPQPVKSTARARAI